MPSTGPGRTKVLVVSTVVFYVFEFSVWDNILTIKRAQLSGRQETAERPSCGAVVRAKFDLRKTLLREERRTRATKEETGKSSAAE